MRLPPKQAFPHSVEYKEIIGQDDWQKPVYGEPITLSAVRFDEGYDFKRQSVNATDDSPNSLVVAFKRYNDDLPDFINQSVLVYRNKEYTIVSVIPLYFMSDEIIGYELEVK